MGVILLNSLGLIFLVVQFFSSDLLSAVPLAKRRVESIKNRALELKSKIKNSIISDEDALVLKRQLLHEIGSEKQHFDQ